ncbi:MAG: NAD(P)-dependent alcohol dehydrogenase [Gammaproteobacteria bacterium]
MLKTPAYAVQSAKSKFTPFTVERREPRAHDVLIDIAYCGICHSDVHAARDEWGGSLFPMVPGHEIVGRVSRVGEAVAKWKVGDTVGVGCFVDSCRKCAACLTGEEQFCEPGASFTYNGHEQDHKTPTFGGYSTRIVVDENYVMRIPDGMDLQRTAPLLCAGITTYSPLKRYHVGPDSRVAVLGLGGLGHVGVRIAHALGAEVTVLSHSPKKKADALHLGADEFVAIADPAALRTHAKHFDFILDTVSAQHDYNAYLNLLRLGGAMVLVGLPEPAMLSAGPLIMGRRQLAGSLIGGIRETQEMLDFCAAHKVFADVEPIEAQYLDQAYERMVKSDVRYRFVIDINSLKAT